MPGRAGQTAREGGQAEEIGERADGEDDGSRHGSALLGPLSLGILTCFIALLDKLRGAPKGLGTDWDGGNIAALENLSGDCDGDGNGPEDTGGNCDGVGDTSSALPPVTVSVPSVVQPSLASVGFAQHRAGREGSLSQPLALQSPLSALDATVRSRFARMEDELGELRKRTVLNQERVQNRMLRRTDRPPRQTEGDLRKELIMERVRAGPAPARPAARLGRRRRRRGREPLKN